MSQRRELEKPGPEPEAETPARRHWSFFFSNRKKNNSIRGRRKIVHFRLLTSPLFSLSSENEGSSFPPLQDAFRGRRLDVGAIVVLLPLSLPATEGGMEKHGHEST